MLVCFFVSLVVIKSFYVCLYSKTHYRRASICTQCTSKR